jgi:hypothetical protein
VYFVPVAFVNSGPIVFSFRFSSEPAKATFTEPPTFATLPAVADDEAAGVEDDDEGVDDEDEQAADSTASRPRPATPIRRGDLLISEKTPPVVTMRPGKHRTAGFAIATSGAPAPLRHQGRG